MQITKKRVMCACGQVQDIEIVVHAPLDVTLASMRAARCEQCGGSELFLGGEKSGRPEGASLEVRANWWLQNGNTGTSSLTLWCAFNCTWVSPHGRFNWPRDPDDFQRCHRLFELIPEWRLEIGKVSERFRWMAPFVDRWEEFERLYVEERYPELYTALQLAGKEAEKIRFGG